MTWYLDGSPVDEIDPEYVSFVYVIENLQNGRRYIGKKTLFFKKTKILKGKKKRFMVESDWQKYYGSNEELLKDIEEFGVDQFKRTILRLCKSKGESSYYESKFIFEADAIIEEQWYNTWISCRVRKSHLCPPKKTRTNTLKSS
jgi:hypothetical protein